MAERPSPDGRGVEREPTEDGALEATGAYETDGSVVLYDTEQPLAWVQSDNAVSLDEMA
jgi:hypothetical protein